MVKVLIVDDSFFMRAALRLQFKAIGCEVVGEADNPEAALEQYRALRPDIVTMDVVLGDVEGMAVVKRIHEENPAAQIIMVSAVGQKMVMEEARGAGATGYVFKPVELSELKAAIQNITGEAL